MSEFDGAGVNGRRGKRLSGYLRRPVQLLK